MRRRVIPLRVATAVARHNRPRFAELHFAGDFAERGDASLDPADFIHVDPPAFALDLAAIGDLSAGLDIERCLAKDYGGAPVGEITLGYYFGVDVERIVAGECRRPALRPSAFAKHVQRDADFLGSALLLRLYPLSLERGLESGEVHRVSTLSRHQLGEIDRKSEGVVQLERIFPGDRAVNRSGSVGGFLWRELVEAAHAAFDRGEEAFLLRARGIDDVLGALAQLGINVAHLIDDDANKLYERRLPATEEPGVAHRAAKNSSQNVAAAFIRRKNAIR